jgi:hypothetical protein
MKMPDGFFRRSGSFGFAEAGPQIMALLAAHNQNPGSNGGSSVNSFVEHDGALGSHANMVRFSCTPFILRSNTEIGLLDVRGVRSKGTVVNFILIGLQLMSREYRLLLCTQTRLDDSSVPLRPT